MSKTIFLFVLMSFFILSGCDDSKNTSKDNHQVFTNKVITSSEINWEQLNPARGDQSPKAATIWGDRHGAEPTGFLVKFIDGFSSPPHIHNVTYRGLVIRGRVHNDDPKAKKMWMPSGSFWTQPAGEVHITAAYGDEIVAYIEIDKGPYLVKPTSEAFNNGERPVNVDKSNMVWLDASYTQLIENNQKTPPNLGPEIAFLWGKLKNNELNGSVIKIPAGFNGEIISSGSIFNAIVIEGNIQYQMPNQSNLIDLEPGSHFSSEGESIHKISSNSETESIIYIRTNSTFKVR